MEVKKFVRYNSEEKRGGEAEIIFGQCQGREVAVRVPNPIPGAPRGAAWMREKVNVPSMLFRGYSLFLHPAEI